MSTFKFQSFEDFTAASNAKAEAKMQEEQQAARSQSASKFEKLLSKFNVASVEDLSEEDRKSFFKKLGLPKSAEIVDNSDTE